MTSLNFSSPYPPTRQPVLAKNIVATSQPLAVQAGVAALREGGNAVDAAVAAAIALTVVEPTSNGIGADAFCIVWDGDELHGLNASGRSPAAVSAADFAGATEMPQRGWDSVTVPGAVSAWVEVSRRFGRLPFARLFDAAIGYARDGFAVAPVTAAAWAEAAEIFTPAEFPDFAPFLPNGRAPRAGEVFRFPAQADTLEKIAGSGGEAFYCGELAEQIAAASKAAGAKLSRDDLAAHRCDWVGTIAANYRARNGAMPVELHEIPPNGQGLAALIMLGLVERHDISRFEVDSPDFFHLQIEAMKLALADAHRYIADPAHLEFPAQRLLDPAYLDARAACIDMRRAGRPEFGVPPAAGTVYLTAADERGMMVSFIQSNFMGFGSGLVIPGTGISLQNRAAGFSLQPGHPNCIAGGKRPFHTIIPGFVMRGGRPLMSFGVMGGPMQPQGHAQMVIRVCDYGQNPQAASDAPRWRVLEGNQVALEGGVDPRVKAELARRGHRVLVDAPDADFAFGGAQLIYAADGAYIAGSDHRKDGMAAGF
ncbi:MAG: gamma-glutamyltransferase family protein [Gammaproteobacteria bacterium]|nr:gamma-glutamyltransferase family protein [Gammaproteobacteria bacterium]